MYDFRTCKRVPASCEDCQVNFEDRFACDDCPIGKEGFDGDTWEIDMLLKEKKNKKD